MDQADKELNAQKDAANVNLTFMQNSMISSGKTWDDLDSTQQAMIYKLEVQAGIAPGTTQSFMNEKPDSEVLAQTTGYDASGNQVVTFIYKDKDGKPGVVETVKTSVTKEGDGVSTDTVFGYVGSDGVKKEYDLGTVAGIKSLIAADPTITRAELFAKMDQEIKSLTVGAINGLLDSAGVTEKSNQYIDVEWIKNAYTQESLEAEARRMGMVTPSGFLGWGKGTPEIEPLISYWMAEVLKARRQGMSDTEIEKNILP